MSETELQEMMKQLDQDGNGVIDFEEFCTYFDDMHADVEKAEQEKSDEANKPSRAQLQQVFSLFDKDKSGSIDRKELGDMLKHMGRPATKEKIAEIFEALDDNNDGGIDFKEFCEYFDQMHQQPDQKQVKSQTEVEPEDNDIEPDGIPLKPLKSSLTALVDLHSSNDRWQRLYRALGTRTDDAELHKNLMKTREDSSKGIKKLVALAKEGKIVGKDRVLLDAEVKRFLETSRSIEAKERAIMTNMGSMADDSYEDDESGTIRKEKPRSTPIDSTIDQKFLKYNKKEIEKRHTFVQQLESDMEAIQHLVKELPPITEQPEKKMTEKKMATENGGRRTYQSDGKHKGDEGEDGKGEDDKEEDVIEKGKKGLLYKERLHSSEGSESRQRRYLGIGCGVVICLLSFLFIILMIILVKAPTAHAD